jgi:hypothetical protein
MQKERLEMNNVIKGFVCTVEEYNGNTKDYRVLAKTAVQTREKLIKQFPDCCVYPAATLKDYVKKKHPAVVLRLMRRRNERIVQI